jgi:hypothetical protein
MLYEIVKELGGDIYDGGRRANIPGPNHRAHDRSVSLTIGRDNRVIAYCHGKNDDWREVLKALREKGLITAEGKPKHAGISTSDGTAKTYFNSAEKAASVDSLWSRGIALERTLSERYLKQGRGVLRDLRSEAILHGSEVPVSAYSNNRGYRLPALMARLQDSGGKLCGLELHYLDAQGRLNSRLSIPRKSIGNYVPGWRVAIDDDAEEMIIATGLMTTLSASDHFGLPAQALLSDKNMRHWRPKPKTRRLIIAADNDSGGIACAEELKHNLKPYDLQVRIELPPNGHNDFNDLYRKPTNGHLRNLPVPAH